MRIRRPGSKSSRHIAHQWIVSPPSSGSEPLRFVRSFGTTSNIVAPVRFVVEAALSSVPEAALCVDGETGGVLLLSCSSPASYV